MTRITFRERLRLPRIIKAVEGAQELFDVYHENQGWEAAARKILDLERTCAEPGCERRVLPPHAASLMVGGELVCQEHVDPRR